MEVHIFFCLPSVYRKLGYIELVERVAEQSMRASVDEVQALPEYSTKGEVHVHACHHQVIP